MRAVHPCVTIFAWQRCYDSAKCSVFLAAVLAVAALRLVFSKVGARAELVALCVSSQSQYTRHWAFGTIHIRLEHVVKNNLKSCQQGHTGSQGIPLQTANRNP